MTSTPRNLTEFVTMSGISSATSGAQRRFKQSEFKKALAQLFPITKRAPRASIDNSRRIDNAPKA